jgi:branched-chain amino acid transport system substrate-binding protein
MTIDLKRACISAILSGLLAATSSSASAQKAYDPGASDTEIKIGNISPYSGPASFYSVIAKTEAAYFRMINERGGINGRKINFISYDDAYSRRRRSSRPESWSKVTKCYCYSPTSVRPAIRLSTST